MFLATGRWERFKVGFEGTPKFRVPGILGKFWDPPLPKHPKLFPQGRTSIS